MSRYFKHIQFFVLVLFVSSLSIESNAQGRIYLNVGKANVKKSLLALPAFQYYGSSSNRRNLNAGQELFNTVSNDLTVASYFQFIKPAAFLEDTSKVGLKPMGQASNGFDFKKWTPLNTEFLIRGGFRVVGGKISLEAYVYYVPQAKLVFGKTYEGPIKSARRVAHTFANDVIKNLTGKRGMFNSKFVFTSNRGGLSNRSVFVMDWDGANAKRVSKLKTLHLSPAWSKDAKKIAYTAYAYHPKSKTRNADLFVYELASGKRWLVSYRKGINSGANFLRDGANLLLTISQGGSPDIFRMGTNGKNLRRLTRGPRGAMNVEPAVSPDGRKIAFSSDRSGRPMIYVMNADGSNVKRVTIAGRYNSSPAWSPDGKQLAFAGFDKGHFDIFVMNANGTKLERLTAARKAGGGMSNNESPSFSPDGRHIVFTSDRTGRNQIYIINPDGTNERRITNDSWVYSKPKWSPFLD